MVRKTVFQLTKQPPKHFFSAKDFNSGSLSNFNFLCKIFWGMEIAREDFSGHSKINSKLFPLVRVLINLGREQRSEFWCIYIHCVCLFRVLSVRVVKLGKGFLFCFLSCWTEKNKMSRFNEKNLIEVWSNWTESSRNKESHKSHSAGNKIELT